MLGRCSSATRSPTSSSRRASRRSGSTRARLGGEMWGYGDRRPARVALLLRRQPRPGARPARTPCAPSPSGPAGRAAAARRSSARPTPSCALWPLLEPAWGPAREVRDRQPLLAHRRPAAGRRPTRPCAGCGRDEVDVLLPACVAMFTEEVGVSPVGRRRRRALPRPGRRAGRRRPGVRPHRGRPGGVQGRDRRGHAGGLPGPGRLGATRRCAAAGSSRRRHGRGGRARPRATSRRSSASTSTTSTRRPARPTAGSASPRSARSCRSCSDARAVPTRRRRRPFFRVLHRASPGAGHAVVGAPAAARRDARPAARWRPASWSVPSATARTSPRRSPSSASSSCSCRSSRRCTRRSAPPRAATAEWLNDQLMVAAVTPPGMGHLESAELAEDLPLARDFDPGIPGRRCTSRWTSSPAAWCCSVTGVLSAAVLFGFAWWAPLVLLAAWGSTHWLLRESGVWKDRNTDEVRVGPAARRRTRTTWRSSRPRPRSCGCSASPTG